MGMSKATGSTVSGGRENSLMTSTCGASYSGHACTAMRSNARPALRDSVPSARGFTRDSAARAGPAENTGNIAAINASARRAASLPVSEGYGRFGLPESLSILGPNVIDFAPCHILGPRMVQDQMALGGLVPARVVSGTWADHRHEEQKQPDRAPDERLDGDYGGRQLADIRSLGHPSLDQDVQPGLVGHRQIYVVAGHAFGAASAARPGTAHTRVV